MNQNVTVDLLIPLWNREKEVLELLSSVQETFNLARLQEPEINIRVIVSDNQSEDGSYRVVEDFAKTNPLLELVLVSQKVHLSFPDHLMELAGLSNGDWAWFLGSDDWLDPASALEFLKVLSAFQGIEDPSCVIGQSLIRSKKDSSLLFRKKLLRGNQKILRVFNVSNSRARRSLFAKSLAVNALGCFISTLALSQKQAKAFHKFRDNPDCAKNIFPHVYFLFAQAAMGHMKNINITTVAPVIWREGNSSFSESQREKCLDLGRIPDSLKFTKSEKSRFFDLLRRHYTIHYYSAFGIRARDLKSPISLGIELLKRSKKFLWR